MKAHRPTIVVALLISTLVFSAEALIDAAGGSTRTIPTGTVMRVRLQTRVGSDISRVEDPVRGTLVDPVVIGGRTIVPARSIVFGSVTHAARSGKVKGRGRLAMRFHTLAPRGDAERYRIKTRPWSTVAPSSKSEDVAKIAIPAAGGAIVGGLVGGTKGAAIGGAAAGGAGTAVVLSTRGHDVRLGPGAILVVRLNEPLTVRDR